jgi:hypothetical protein
MATAEHYVKLLIGDLVLRNALLQERVDRLEEQLEKTGVKAPGDAGAGPYDRPRETSVAPDGAGGTDGRSEA